MKVLSIGNSFSQDALSHLHEISSANGKPIQTYNLMFGGCSLEQHFRFYHSEEKRYNLEMNGVSTGFYVSLKEALITQSYDVVTLQQASHLSFDADSYTPYLSELAKAVRYYQPKAKLFLHQTWAYEEGSQRLKSFGFESREEMFRQVKNAYESAKASIQPDGMILSGELFQRLVAEGFQVHRDTFHASMDVGRYALGLLWFKTLTGTDAEQDGVKFSIPGVDDATALTIRKTVNGL